MRRSEVFQGVRLIRFRGVLGRYETGELNQIEAAEMWHNRADVPPLVRQDLRGKQADAIADAYRGLVGRPHDPILHPYFAALIAYAETGVAIPWWRIMRAEAHAKAC